MLNHWRHHSRCFLKVLCKPGPFKRDMCEFHCPRSLCTKTKRNMVWPWCWEFWTVLRYSENLEGGILCWKVSAAISWMMLHDIPFRWSPVYMLTPDLPWVWRQRKRQRTRPTDWEHLFLVSKMAFSPNILGGMQSVSFRATYSWYHLYLRYMYIWRCIVLWYLILLYIK